jgi:trimeric autotransporter adhesin
MRRYLPLFEIVVFLGSVATVIAQQPSLNTAIVASNASVPDVVAFNGALLDEAGKPLHTITGITFGIYRDSQGGAPLWIETQNVQPDPTGRYSVLLGSTTASGLPLDIFVSGEARWLEVQLSGQAAQPRVLLAAVPYALKAKEAETISGLPASALIPALTALTSRSASSTTPLAFVTPAVSGTGTTDFIPLWTNSTGALGNSVVFQSGSGSTAKIGINTVTPAVTLDVTGAATIRGTLTLPSTGTATATGGKISQAELFVASAFNSSSAAGINQKFQWQVEPTGNNTAATAGSLNLLYASGTTTPAETGFKINSKGILTFASGQTFPGGSGTVTSVGSGAGLTGGPITTSGTLSIASAGVTNAMLQHSSVTVTPGTGLTGGGSLALGGTTTLNVDITKVPQLGANNTFTGSQTVTGNLNVSGLVGIGTTAPAQKLEVDSGNLLVKGASNFKATGNTAFLYVGDTNHPIEALFNTGLSIGAFKVPSAVFIQDKTGFVGVGTTSPAGAFHAITAVATVPAGIFDNTAGGELLSLRSNGVEQVGVQGNGMVQIASTDASGMVDITSPSSSMVGLSVTGWPSTQSDQVNGTDALHAHGGDAPEGGGGGAGIVASGGGGDEETGGGPGVVGFGGGPGAGGGAGGGFLGAGGKDADGDGIDATPGSNVPSGFAGNFDGDVNVTGSVITGTSDVRIDDPLDPANKYLVHTSVASSEMKNMYDGMVTLDGNGAASVPLPAWFEALNGDFRYQLTAIGKSSPGLYVSEEVSNHHFSIAGGMPGTKVSWQITGVRKDPYAMGNPLIVEKPKSNRERGFYAHPAVYGQPEEKGVEWARNPRWMAQVKAMRARQAAALQAMKQHQP